MKQKDIKPARRKRLAPEVRRARIIETARSVFSTSGANQTRVWEIAKEAGITEPFLYRHFESRDELFKLAILDPLDDIVEKLSKETSALANHSDMGREEALRSFHELFLKDVIEMMPLVAAAQFSDPIEAPKFYSDTLFPKIRQNIAVLISRFTGWDVNSREIDLTVQALIGVHFGIALESVLGGGKLDIGKVAEDLTHMFAKGLMGPKGSSAKPGSKWRKSLTQDSAAKIPAASLFSEAEDEALPKSDAPPKKRLSKAERTKVILAAARDLFLRHGFGGTRSKDMAQQAGITEAFMFRFFDSKQQMYDMAILEPLKDAFADFAERVKEIGDASSQVDFLMNLNRLSLSFFIVNGPLCRTALFSELSKGQQYYKKVLSPYLKVIRKVIVEHIGPIDSSVDPETVRRAIIGAQWGMSLDRSRQFSEEQTEEIALILTRLFTAGVRPKPNANVNKK